MPQIGYSFPNVKLWSKELQSTLIFQNFPKSDRKVNKTNLDIFVVFYQLCHLSLAIPVPSLAIPCLSLAIPGLALLVPSQFQDVPNSSRLLFYQHYINS